VDLVELDGRVYKNSQVHQAQTDYLNSVLRGESIIDENELVYKGENKQPKIGGNGLRVIARGLILGDASQVGSEFGKDIAIILISTDGSMLSSIAQP
jgi:hypothetical protein